MTGAVVLKKWSNAKKTRRERSLLTDCCTFFTLGVRHDLNRRFDRGMGKLGRVLRLCPHNLECSGFKSMIGKLTQRGCLNGRCFGRYRMNFYGFRVRAGIGATLTEVDDLVALLVPTGVQAMLQN